MIVKNTKKYPEIISRVHIRFSGINEFKTTQPQKIFLLPKVELSENRLKTPELTPKNPKSF